MCKQNRKNFGVFIHKLKKDKKHPYVPLAYNLNKKAEDNSFLPLMYNRKRVSFCTIGTPSKLNEKKWGKPFCTIDIQSTNWKKIVKIFL